MSAYDESNSDSFLAKLRYTGVDGLTLEYKYDRQEVHATPDAGQSIGYAPTSPLLALLANFYPFQAPGAVAQSRTRLSVVNEDHVGAGDIKNDGHMLTGEVEVNDRLSARSITAYRRTRVRAAPISTGRRGSCPCRSRSRRACRCRRGHCVFRAP